MRLFHKLARKRLLTRPISLMMGLFLVMMNYAIASAHQDPAGCNATGVTLSMTVYRADGTTPVGGGSVQSGETIKYAATLSHAGGSNCNFEGGTVTITDPSGTAHVVGTPGLVSSGSPFTSSQATYVVDEGDVAGGFLSASTSYTGGTAHLGDNSHPPVTASTGIATLYSDVSLVVTKDAAEAFNSTCTWSIDKTVDVDQYNLLTGENGTSNYDVLVTPTCSDTDFSVSGSITIQNPATFATAVVTGVSDDVGGVGATVNCGLSFPHNLAPGASLICTYSASLPDNSTRTNTATATTSGDVGGDDGTAQVDFTGVNPTSSVNGVVNVTDSVEGVLGVCDSSSSASCLYEYDRVFTCDQDAGTHPNIATIVETGQTANASVSVVCTPPQDLSCTYTQGYWKTHSAYGPAAHPNETWIDPQIGGPDASFYSSGKSWLGVFTTAVKGNAYYNLAHQFMAAKLNVESGASTTPAVDSALTQALSLLNTYTPAQVAAMKGNNPTRQQFINLAGILGSYNEGDIGPGHCDQ